MAAPGDGAKGQAFFQALQTTVPGRAETYLEGLMAINRATNRRLAEVLPPSALQAFLAFGLDLGKIQTGYNLLFDAEAPAEDVEFLTKKDTVRRKFDLSAKPTLDELVGVLGITDETVKKRVGTIITDGQKEFFGVLAQPAASGPAPLDQLKLVGADAASMRVFLKATLRPRKGRTTTFAQEGEAIKNTCYKKLAKLLTKPQYELFRSLNLDFPGIQAGYNPFLDIMKRRVGGWFGGGTEAGQE